ncbi:hypothetical protein F1880_002482 [Penicillium rolfsii]|nr:hypothetical protein F1880_002482 [Penicillium rolfsii]
MSITHVVLFQFKAGTDAQVIKDVRCMMTCALLIVIFEADCLSTKTCDRMIGLKDNCIHPASNKPYIKASSGGMDNSIEGIQNGITHAFVVEFSSAEDRDYYVREDPAHRAFVQSLDGVIEKAQVIDFTDGVY